MDRIKWIKYRSVEETHHFYYIIEKKYIYENKYIHEIVKLNIIIKKRAKIRICARLNDIYFRSNLNLRNNQVIYCIECM